MTAREEVVAAARRILSGFMASRKVFRVTFVQIEYTGTGLDSALLSLISDRRKAYGTRSGDAAVPEVDA